MARKYKISKSDLKRDKAREKEMDRLGVGLREYDSMKLSRKLARQKSRRTTR